MTHDPGAGSAFARLSACFDTRGAHPAVCAGGSSWTYTEIARRARGYARGLQGLGLDAGDRIAVLCDPHPDQLTVLVGHYHLHAVHVPINTRYRGQEIAHILDDSGARLIVCDAAHLDVLDALPAPLAGLPRVLVGDAPATALREQDRTFEQLIGPPTVVGDPRDEDPALIIYTSGTTGKSKGVELTFRAVVDNMAALTGLWQWTRSDRLVLALPLFHVHGLCIGLHGALLHGMTVDLLPRFEPSAVVEAIADGGTIFMGVPTMYRMLLEHLEAHPEAAEVLRRARLFTAGSAALPAADFRQFHALTGHRILERYGMSETLITLSNPYEGERRPGSVGQPVPGCQVRLVDDEGAPVPPGEPGEIEVRSNGIMRGYRGDPAATAAAFHDGEATRGWFRTGDVATVSDDGYYSIVGRRSVDVIKSGGFKISAREIEECVARHPKVREVAVLGLDDPKWGQKITAAIVPADPSFCAEPRDALLELAGFVSQHLAEFKKPRALVVLDAVPRNALGKVQKHRILEAVRARQLAVTG